MSDIPPRLYGYAPGPFGQVHYQSWGSGIPLILCHQSPSSCEQFSAIYMHREVNQMLRAGDTLWYGHAASFVYDQLARLSLIRAPSLILTNTGDLTFPIAQRAKARRPDFAYVEPAGGTHDVIDEQPDAVSRSIVAFVLSQHLH